MIGAQTRDELVTRLEGDLAWRRKEIRAILKMATSSAPPMAQTFMRSTVALCYAHLEGFVKQAADSYMEFVGNQRLTYSELSHTFYAIAVAPRHLPRIQSDDPISAIKDLVILMETSASTRARIASSEDIFRTWGNLSSRVLRRLLRRMDFDENIFELKSKMIDELVTARNYVAHGKVVSVSSQELEAWCGLVIEIMETVQREIENAVVLERYRRAGSAARSNFRSTPPSQ